MRSCAIYGRLIVLLSAGLVGCQSPPVVVPHVTEWPVAQSVVSPGAEPEDNAYLRVDRSASKGRFVAGMTVVRVENRVGENAEKPELHIAEIKQRDTAYWTNATRDLSSISFLTFFDWSSVPTRVVSVRELLTAAQRIDTRLLLVYAGNDVGPEEAEFVGGLYDTTTGQLLCAAKSYAAFDNPDPEVASVNQMEGDFRAIDARYQAARHFERLIHDGIHDLSLTDSPDTQLRSNEWGPMTMPEWPWPVKPVK